MTDSGNISSDEDFGPMLPGLGDRAARDEPLLKQHRVDEAVKAADKGVSSILPTHSIDGKAAPPTRPTVARVADSEETKEPSTNVEVDTNALLWSYYCQHDFPISELYERSFLHDNDAPGVQMTNGEDGAAVSALEAGAAGVKDVAAMTDALGELIFSIDSKGAVRVWRKLPRGMLFMGCLTNLFSRNTAESTCEATLTLDCAAKCVHTQNVYHYFIRADSVMQWLFFIQVVEHRDVFLSFSDVENAVGAVAIGVTLLSVNPTTLRVEYQNHCRFDVPTARIPLRGLESQHKAEGQCVTSTATVLEYTRQPFLLQHRHEPYLAFFVKRVPEAVHHCTKDVGVVMFPCKPPRVRKQSRKDHCQTYLPSKISVANLISCCVQQRHPPASGRSGSSEASGGYPVVLVDDHGIVDYATICELGHTSEEALLDDGNIPQVKLTLKVMGGLSMACASGLNSIDARLAKRWITFDRRQRTDFFALMRDVQAHARQKREECVAATCSADEKQLSGEKEKNSAVTVGVMPLRAELVFNGRYFVILSVRWTAVPVQTFDVKDSRTTRVPLKLHRIEFEQCLHVFHFSSGMCVGKHIGWVGGARLALGSDPKSELVPYMEALTHQSTVGISVVESSSPLTVPGEWSSPESNRKNPSGEPNTVPTVTPCVYIWVPDFFSPNFVGLFEGVVQVQMGRMHEQSRGTENQVHGRRVEIFQVFLYLNRTAASQRSAGMAHVFRMPRCIGELEYVMRRGGPRASAACDASTSPCLIDGALSEKLLLAGAGGFHAPCVLLRRGVVPSQDLKNLLMQSYVGAMLAPEEMKRLFSVPIRPLQQPHHGSTQPVQGTQGEIGPAAYPLMITTSLPSLEDSCSAEASWGCALLIYAAAVDPVVLHEVKLGMTDLTRVSSPAAVDASPSGGELEGTNAESQRGGQDALTVGQKSGREIWDQWQAILLKLHQQRDFSCAELLGRQTDSKQPCSISVEAPKNLAESPNDPLPEASNDKKMTAVKDLEEKTETPAEAVVCDEDKELEKLQVLLTDTGIDLIGETPLDRVPMNHNTSLLQHALVHVRGYGTIYVRLLPQVAPLAVEKFCRSALRGDYNKTLFHRIVPKAIIQGGCPKGDGTDGEVALDEGGSCPDESTTRCSFFSYTQIFVWLCMPNTGKNKNSLQFIFTVPDAPELPWLSGCHTVFGLVFDGKEHITRINQVPFNEANGKPLTDIVIERLDVY